MIICWFGQSRIPGLLLYGLFLFCSCGKFSDLWKPVKKDDRFFLFVHQWQFQDFAVLSFFWLPDQDIMWCYCWCAGRSYFSHKNSALVSSGRNGRWGYFISVMFLLATCSTIASLFWFSGEIHLKAGPILSVQENFNAMNRGRRTWLEVEFFQLDGTLPVINFNGMACFYSGNLAGAKITPETTERINLIIWGYSMIWQLRMSRVECLMKRLHITRQA